MIVVSDSTPLISLMKASKLDILKKLFGDVLIPEAVFSELTTNDAFPKEAALIRKSEFIKVVTVSDHKAVSLLQRATGLDRGESEAIVYADDTHADLLLMDEVQGRKVAKSMGLPIMGSVGILINAFRDGLLTEADVETALNRMKQTGRHISDRLIQDALDIVHSEL